MQRTDSKHSKHTDYAACQTMIRAGLRLLCFSNSSETFAHLPLPLPSMTASDFGESTGYPIR